MGAKPKMGSTRRSPPQRLQIGWPMLETGHPRRNEPLPEFSGSGGETLTGADCSPPPPLVWSPTAAVRLSLCLHALAAAGLLSWPAAWPWWIGAVLANHAVLAAVGMPPRSTMLGPNLVRLPPTCAVQGIVALSFDDGPDPEVTPRVMDLLEQHGATASFFCIGERMEAWPDIVRDIVGRGHSVENHTQRHANAFACFGFGALRREIEDAQRTAARIAGQAPRFFRAPAGLRSPLLDPILCRTGLPFTTWTRRGHDCVRRDPEAVFRRLTARLRGGDIILLHDGSCARTRDGTAVVLAVLPRFLEHLRARGLRAMSLPRALDAGTAPSSQRGEWR